MLRTLIPVPKIEEDGYDWHARHEEKTVAAREHYDLVFIGDSLTHFWEDLPEKSRGGEIWKQYAPSRRTLNLGFGFDRTQNVLWRLENGELPVDPGTVILNIGTNQFSVTPRYDGDAPEAAAAGILAVVEKLRTLAPRARLIVMALFPRGPVGGPWRDAVDRTRKLVGEALPAGVEYADLQSELLLPSGELKPELYGDATHLSAAGYRVWAELLVRLGVWDRVTSPSARQ